MPALQQVIKTGCEPGNDRFLFTPIDFFDLSLVQYPTGRIHPEKPPVTSKRMRKVGI